MDRILSNLYRWATPRKAVLALALFGLNALLLQVLDRPLARLAGGQMKPDLRFGYDLPALQSLFTAYGEQGRAIYVWNLAVDTPFPVIGALAVSLFALLAFQTGWTARLALAPPLVFALTDLVENVLLFGLVQTFPELSPGLVALASLITQVKRSAYYASMLVLLASLLALLVRRILRKPRPAAPTS